MRQFEELVFMGEKNLILDFNIEMRKLLKKSNCSRSWNINQFLKKKVTFLVIINPAKYHTCVYVLGWRAIDSIWGLYIQSTISWCQ